MVVRKCDFCGREGAKNITLPQYSYTNVTNSIGQIVSRIKESNIVYQNFDICSDCQEKLLDLIELLKIT